MCIRMSSGRIIRWMFSVGYDRVGGVIQSFDLLLSCVVWEGRVCCNIKFSEDRKTASMNPKRYTLVASRLVLWSTYTTRY